MAKEAPRELSDADVDQYEVVARLGMDAVLAASLSYPICEPAAVYELAKRFYPDLSDPDAQMIVLRQIAARPDHGHVTVGDSWREISDLLSEFHLKPVRVVTRAANREALGIPDDDPSFQLELTDDPVREVPPYSLLMLQSSADPFACHTAWFDGSKNSATLLTHATQTYDTLQALIVIAPWDATDIERHAPEME